MSEPATPSRRDIPRAARAGAASKARQPVRKTALKETPAARAAAAKPAARARAQATPARATAKPAVHQAPEAPPAPAAARPAVHKVALAEPSPAAARLAVHKVALAEPSPAAARPAVHEPPRAAPEGAPTPGTASPTRPSASAAIADEVIASVREAQEVTLDVASTWAALMDELYPGLRPFFFNLVKPEIPDFYDFAEEVVASQRQFAFELARTLLPAG